MKRRLIKLTGLLLAGFITFTSMPLTSFATELDSEIVAEEQEESEEISDDEEAQPDEEAEGITENAEESDDKEDEASNEEDEALEDEESEDAEPVDFLQEEEETTSAPLDEITELGSEDLSGEHFTYTAADHKLVLDGYSGYGFSCETDTLKLELNGNNELYGTWGNPAIYSGAGIIILGTGRIGAHGDGIVAEQNIQIQNGTIADCNLISNKGGVSISGPTTIVRVDKIQNVKSTTIYDGKVVADSITNPVVTGGSLYLTSTNSMVADKLIVEGGTVKITETSTGTYKTSLEYPIVGDVVVKGGVVDITANYGARSLNVSGGEIKINSKMRAVSKTVTAAKGLILEAGETEAKSAIVTRIVAEKYVKVWQAFKIDFDTKEGLNTVPSQAVKLGETIDEPVEVIPPTGHRLKGWYRTRPEKSNKWNFEDPVDGNMILYAIWEPIVYTVTFDPTGGSVSETTRGVKYKTKYGGEGADESLIELPVPTKDECEFVGWYTKRTGGSLVTKDTVLTNPVNHTLYARYDTKKYNVTLELDGGMIRSSESAVVKVPSGETLLSQPDYAEPIKAGGVFERWETEDGTTYNITSPVTSDITIYAKYRLSDGVASPVFSVEGGEVVKGRKLYLDCPTVGAAIYYTTDGSDPLTSSTKAQYDDAIIINSNQTIKAVATRYGFNPSSVVSVDYTVRDDSLYWGDITVEDKTALSGDINKIPKGLWVSGYDEHVDYTGSAVNFDNLRVYFYKRLLTKDVDYTVKITNNINAGNGNIAVTGKGNYSGAVNVAFTIDPINFTDTDIDADRIIYLMYNKRVQKGTTPVVLKKDGQEKVLKAGTDFYFDYVATGADAYKEIGTYDINIVGKGNYSGTVTIQEEITTNATMANVTVAKIANQPCTGSDIEPVPVVKYGRVELVEGVDYDVEYLNNKWPGVATIKLIGIGSYKGNKIVNFNITGTALTRAIFDKTLTTNCDYNGEPHEPVVDGTSSSDSTASLKYKVNATTTISLLGKEKSAYEDLSDPEKDDIDYIYEYVGDTREVGTVVINFTGVNRYTGSVSKSFKINGVAMSGMVVEYTQNYTYTGSPCDPASESTKFSVYKRETAKEPKYTLKKGVDYDVTYQIDAKTDNIKAGTATMIITGKNGYTGTIKKTFKINPYDIEKDPGIRISVNPITAEPFHKGGAKPRVSIEDRGVALVEGVDYTLKYENNTPQTKKGDDDEENIPTVTIIGKGNYTGTIAKPFAITIRNIAEVDMTASDINYQKKAGICRPAISLIDTDGKALANGTDYSNVKYYYQRDTKVTQMVNKNEITLIKKMGSPVATVDIIPAGTEIRAVVDGIGNYKGSKYAIFRYVSANISSAAVTVKNQIYDGDPVELTKDDITVKVGTTILNKSDYDIVGFENNDKKGTATVTLKGAGSYGGKKTVKFNILAKTMNYTLVFDKNADDATGAMPNAEVSGGAAVPANRFKRNGYAFAGWIYDDENPSLVIADKGPARFDKLKQPVGSMVTLKAKWTPVEYQIKYMLNGGTNNGSNPATYNIEDSITLENPTKDGYTFGGWYTNSAFRSGYEIKTINPGRTGVLTIYAKWIKE